MARLGEETWVQFTVGPNASALCLVTVFWPNCEDKVEQLMGKVGTYIKFSSVSQSVFIIINL